ncbi:MAG: lipocalin family protein [Prosthecobacter sp.]
MKMLLALSLVLVSCSSQRPMRTVGQVNLSRYAGHWYEISRLPNTFQRDDSRATADYTAQQDGSIRVVNTEYRPDGSTRTATGRATAVSGSNGARLRVKFEGLAALVPAAVEGNYWIIALEPDYSVALVGTPDRKFLWLLSRGANISPSTKERYLRRAREEGFDTAKLISPASPSKS